jgi:predicted transcriptional regulator YdeE
MRRPQSAHDARASNEGLNSIKRYDEKFDPLTGNGGFKIWVPVRD